MTFSYIAQTTFKRAHKCIYGTLKIVFKFTAEQVCQKPLFTETHVLHSRSCADVLQAALFDGTVCVPQPYLDAGDAALPVMSVPNVSQFLKMRRGCTKNRHKTAEGYLHIQAAHCCSACSTGFGPGTLGSGVVLAIKPLVHPCPAVFHQKPFFARSLGNSAEKPADISGVLSRTSTSPLREI